ncbi:ParB N-terminal domain-containing protein [Pseudooceanicola sp. 502str34]
MKFLHGGNVQRIALDHIEVSSRLREVRDAFVENLIVMAEDTGITTPIHVRKSKAGYILIDGAHTPLNEVFCEQVKSDFLRLSCPSFTSCRHGCA